MPQFRRKTKRTHKAGAKGKAKEESDSSAEETGGAAAAALEAKEKAAQLKAEGNTAFSAGQWEVALGKFTEAIALDPTDHVFFSNRSAANLQLLRTRDAVSDARECVRLNPTWPKGHSRLGAALFADKQAIAAKAAYEEGLKLEPANAAMLEGLAAAKPAAAEEEKRLEEERKQEAPEGAAQAQTSVAPPEETTVIGIDLGTTFSCCAIWRHGNVEILEDESGSRTTPSFVAFTEDGGRLVGEAAKMQAAKNTKNTFYDIKRILGQKMVEPKVREEVKRFPFEVVADPATDDPRIVVEALGGKQMPPEQISGLVLAHMKRVAEAKLGHPVKKAVVTVPAYFNDAQRTATKAAGAIAGLDVLRIINEPTAAALAYGLDKNDTGAAGGGCKVLIYDLGGGTFDVSLLAIEDGIFEVKATAGDTHLGGEDFDNRMLSHCIAEFRRKYKSDPTRNQRAIRRLRTQCERAKRQLSSQTQVTIEVDSLHEGNDFSLRVSRAKFEELCMDFFKNSMEPVTQCLADSGLSKSMIKEIVMVGGSTRIPKVQQLISNFFNGKSLCKSINPDEAVAYGAAVQAAIVSGTGTEEVQNMLLLDVAPLSLGIEMAGGMMERLIERNSTIPTNKSKDFTTAEDYQEYVDINVYEGERTLVRDNNYLGKFTLKGLPKTLRGVPKIRVAFNIDTNGILTIEAMDSKNNLRGSIEIENEKGRLSQREIERMLSDAEVYRQSDSLAREEMVARESLKGYMARLRKSMDDFDESKMSARDRDRLAAKFAEVEAWLKDQGDTSTRQECEEKQQAVEAAWNTVMIKVNQALDDFWDQQLSELADERMLTVDRGGFFVSTGFDLRELIDDPD
mmetsp:Transcript_11313/g.35044  ORF Transcript_11313/g.35044 Transcript_11313/m.35044 type:complete len:849 (-) Transcript_11313:113-2659(-)